MAGYIGSKTVNLSTTGADIAGDADVSGALDVGGNLLVGTTSTAISNEGAVIFPSGVMTITNDGGRPLRLNRKTSDGDILHFDKDGATVGSIGVNTAGASDLNLSVMSGDVGLRFRPNDDSIVPINGSGSFRDNAIDLGLSNARFKDLYLSGGVYLGGTGSANKLDDYETGTFTPTSSTKAQVYYASYTKVGQLVTIHTCLQVLSGQSVATIALPFLPRNTSQGGNTSSQTNNRYGGHCTYFTPSSGSAPLTINVFHQGNQGSSAYFIAKSATTSQFWTYSLPDSIGNIAITMSYVTDS